MNSKVPGGVVKLTLLKGILTFATSQPVRARGLGAAVASARTEERIKPMEKMRMASKIEQYGSMEGSNTLRKRN